MIPYGRQEISQADIDAVSAVLQSDWLTQGPTISRFEIAVASKVGAQYGVAVNSATSALHIACLALGLKPGDRLWTVPNTFVASANCARYCGADVDFVDIDSDTCNIDVEALRKRLFAAKVSGSLPKILIPVHFAGQPTDQSEIAELAREFGFRIIEDASHAIGAARSGEPVGSCRWSDVTVFSFHPVKLITSGEGGMALTNDAEIAWRMEMLRSHGITREVSRMVETDPPAWHYEQQALGFNYRMTDIHAALGLSQLGRLDAWVERRNTLARRYEAGLRGMPIRIPVVRPENRSAWHLFVIRVAEGCRRSVFDALRAANVGVNVHYTPVHLQPYYRALGFAVGQFPVAEAHGRTALTLPLYPGLADADVDRVVEALAEALENST